MNELSAIAVGKATSHLVSFQGVFIHKDTLDDLIDLRRQAEIAGFDLVVASGFRDFDRQLAIWNNKFSGERPVFDLNGRQVDMNACAVLEKVHAIMLFSALPGASRHHFGSDLDVYAKNLTSTEQPLQLTPDEYLRGAQLPFNLWLNEVLPTTRFYRPYAEYQGGIAQEPWHISHYPVADKLFKLQSIESIRQALDAADIAGKAVILEALPDLYTRYIANLCERH